MNAHTAKEELALLSTGFSRADALFDVNAVPVRPARTGLFARIGAWLSQARERRAVMEELSMLTDRELADIGLARSDVPRVFDRAFADLREEQRAGAGRAFGAYKIG
jgi:uncharacterized protein YjiS (DUF1127 family)